MDNDDEIEQRSNPALLDQCIFTTEDVLQTRNPLIRLLRVIIMKEDITLSKLNELHTTYWRKLFSGNMQMLGIDGNPIRSLVKRTSPAAERQSLRAAIYETEKLTWKSFVNLVSNIFSLHIVALSVKIRKDHPDGNYEYITYSSDEFDNQTK